MKAFRIKDALYIEPVLRAVRDEVKRAIEGGKPIELILKRPDRTREQEKKYHAMIGDISDSVVLDGRQFDDEIWKTWLVEEFERELNAMGQQLRHPGRVILSRDGQRLVTIRAATSRFTVSESSDFIEFLYHTGTELGAVFTDRSLIYYEEEARRAA